MPVVAPPATEGMFIGTSASNDLEASHPSSSAASKGGSSLAAADLLGHPSLLQGPAAPLLLVALVGLVATGLGRTRRRQATIPAAMEGRRPLTDGENGAAEWAAKLEHV